MARREGFEPSITWLKTKGLYHFVYVRILAASLGLEPRLRVPETRALPIRPRGMTSVLDYDVVLSLVKVAKCPRARCHGPG